MSDPSTWQEATLVVHHLEGRHALREERGLAGAHDHEIEERPPAALDEAIVDKAKEIKIVENLLVPALQNLT